MDEQKLAQALERLDERIAKLESGTSSVTSSTEYSEAEAHLKEKDEQIVKLEDKIVELQGKAEKLDRLGEVIGTADGFADLAKEYGYDDPAKFAELATRLGYPLPEATQGEVAEVEEKQAGEERGAEVAEPAGDIEERVRKIKEWHP